jgi:hypothetical protein
VTDIKLFVSRFNRNAYLPYLGKAVLEKDKGSGADEES